MPRHATERSLSVNALKKRSAGKSITPVLSPNRLSEWWWESTAHSLRQAYATGPKGSVGDSARAAGGRAAGRRGIRRGAGPGSVCKEAGASHSPALRSRTRHGFEDPVGWRRRIERSGRHLELVNWRMCKKKQMGWSRTGAQYLLY